jgi:hypothetical protein
MNNLYGFWSDISSWCNPNAKYIGYVYLSNKYQYFLRQNGERFRRRIFKTNNSISFGKWTPISKRIK